MNEAIFERSVTPFRERVYALVGHGTFREPAAGRSSEIKAIPADHMIAAALSFGRIDRRDVGPDIAEAMALGRLSHNKTVAVLRWLGAVLANDRGPKSIRCREWIGHISIYAFNAVVMGRQPPPAPAGISSGDWGETIILAGLLLERMGEDALARAARNHQQVA